jgi:hypothetical protein
MEVRCPTREELVRYIAEVVQREGPLSKSRQEEVILEAFENLRNRRPGLEEKTYH